MQTRLRYDRSFAELKWFGLTPWLYQRVSHRMVTVLSLGEILDVNSLTKHDSDLYEGCSGTE